MYNVIIIKAYGFIERSQQDKKPDYKQIREAVDGFIQIVPHLNKMENYKRGEAYVNEEGLIRGLPFNQKATEIWLENLGKGHFSYEPRLFGDMIYIVKEPKVK